MLNEMLSRFELLLKTVVRIRRKEKVILQNAPHRTPNDKKMATNGFLSKIREYWINVRLCIVKLKSGGQQLPIAKKNLSLNIFNLENPFLIKAQKTYVYTQLTECSIVTRLHHPELKSRA